MTFQFKPDHACIIFVPVLAQGVLCVRGEAWLHHPQGPVPLGGPLQAGGAVTGISGLATALS